MGSVLWTALLIFGALTSVRGYKDGKVEKSCDNMSPRHGGQANTTASPYTLSVDGDVFKPGDQIRVTLSGSQNFEGFMVEARDAGDPSGLALGTFTLLTPESTQLLKCNNIKGSAVSHTSSAKMTEVGMIWNAPSDAPAVVHFLATVVAHYNNFWVKIPSRVITQSGVTPGPPQSTSTTTSTPTKPTAVLPESFSSEGCGRIKSCLLDPVGCNPASDAQCFYLSYRREGMSVEFELSGPAQGYVSFALSEDKRMGHDDVYQCVYDEGHIHVEAAYVSGRTHPEIAAEPVLSDVGWRVADGVIQCKFRRPISVPADPQRFDLNRSYYLFVAHGTARNGEIHKHRRQPLISAQRQLITGPPQIGSGSRSPLIMKYHGSLMLVAWMIAGSTGTFIAGFLKPDWPERTLFGQKIWFQVHRILMVLTLIPTVVGFTFPFVYRGHWSRGASSHAVLGCVVLALTVIQPVMAAFRPAPDSSRGMFNRLHWAAGNTAEILAVAAMFIGMRQESLLLPFPWTTGVLSAFVVWVVFSKIVLVVYKKGLCDKGRKGSEEHSVLTDSTVNSVWVTRIKVAVLTVFTAGSSVFCISLLCAISQI